MNLNTGQIIGTFVNPVFGGSWNGSLSGNPGIPSGMWQVTVVPAHGGIGSSALVIVP